MALATLVFWLVALLTAGSAIMVVAARNILHAAFSLCLTFLGVAALYVFLHADFVAAAQVIVYVGGILVLILFAIMFSSNAMKETGEHQQLAPPGKVGAALGSAPQPLLQCLLEGLRRLIPACGHWGLGARVWLMSGNVDRTCCPRPRRIG